MMTSCRADRRVTRIKSLDSISSLPLSLRAVLVSTIAVVFALVVGTADADAIVIDFSSGPTGNLGTSHVEIMGVSVDGFYWDGDSWEQANLYRRNETNDHGLGVCSTGEDCAAGGDFNELSNNVNPELIRLTLPAGFFWTGVGVSSLDTNGGEAIERGQAFATSNSDPSSLFPIPNTLTPGAFWEFAATADSGAAVEPTFMVTGGTQFLEFIFFRPFDFSGGATYGYNRDNDYLVHTATIEPVPEPGTVALFAVGLAGLGLAIRRKKS